MNCGRMRRQASDNFTYGSCVDKTLIYTDELWFTPQNVEEGKCILEGTPGAIFHEVFGAQSPGILSIIKY